MLFWKNLGTTVMSLSLCSVMKRRLIEEGAGPPMNFLAWSPKYLNPAL